MKLLYQFLSCFVLILNVGILMGCNSSEKINSIDTSIIEDKWKGFVGSWDKMDAEGCASYYLPDGINIAPEFPINEGREAIAKFYQFLFDMHHSAKYMHKTINLEVVGDSIIELGEFSVDWVRKDGSEWKFNARAMVLWEEKNGEWMIKKLVFNEAPNNE